MKVVLKYEEGDDKELHMTLRLTLPQKYVNGPTREVVKLFVDHFNKKHPADKLTAEEFHIKIVGGDHLEGSAKVRDTMASGDECFLLPDSQRTAPVKRPSSETTVVSAPAPDANASTPSAPSTAPREDAAGKPAKKPIKDERGRVRCKNFGCNRMFDPDGEPTPCTHHKAAPIFHETAKWWSCCPDRKAYDWEEFMRIPGCTESYCTAVAEQGQRRALGGCDVRGQNAPIRLDADAPPDPNKKLDDLRKGLIAIGVDKELFERVWNQLAAEAADPEKVCEQFRQRFTAILNKPDL